MSDALIVGDGVIGLATALAIARAGGSCRILGRTVPGAASAASAGLLAPSIGSADPVFRSFMIASRDLYPAWLHWLAERTGIEVTLNRRGIIELGANTKANGVESTRGEHLAHNALQALEPAIAPTDASLHPTDGYVDNVRLLAALQEAVRCEWSIEVVEGRASGIEPGIDGCTVTTEDGRTQRASCVILAAGAWSALISGAPRPIPVEPVRGQMLQLAGAPLSHAVSAPDAYLVPRGDSTLVGSTLERVGFDSSTTSPALEHLRAAACAVVPEFTGARVERAWAGLRPMTPDGLPVLGRDPDLPSVIYACGHAKNGILLAPITAECIAAEVAGSTAPMPIDAFRVQRFV
ncbi:MAG TPA: FAD-dependent oxidoreductase [Gemmatimonadaceae bacterium]|nr:FAD-dependent oxidoreductase [Gemmatimonadaceae bacterium]